MSRRRFDGEGCRKAVAQDSTWKSIHGGPGWEAGSIHPSRNTSCESAATFQKPTPRSIGSCGAQSSSVCWNARWRSPDASAPGARRRRSVRRIPELKHFLAGREFPAAFATTPEFYPALLETFRAVMPLVRFLERAAYCSNLAPFFRTNEEQDTDRDETRSHGRARTNTDKDAPIPLA